MKRKDIIMAIKVGIIMIIGLGCVGILLSFISTYPSYRNVCGKPFISTVIDDIKFENGTATLLIIEAGYAKSKTYRIDGTIKELDLPVYRFEWESVSEKDVD